MRVAVAIDLALDRLFTYEVPVELSKRVRAGQLVNVPFGRRFARGFVMRLDPPVAADLAAKLKPIVSIADEAPFFSESILKLVEWIARYTVSPLELCLKTAVPGAVLKPDAHPKELLFAEPVASAPNVKLTPRQQSLLAEVKRVGGGWMTQLCREFTTTPATLKTLAGKGVLAIAPRAKRRDPLAGRAVMPSKPLPLNPEQAAALAIIEAPDDMRPVLLHGVTGSGKTEIYLQAIAHELAAGRGAIVLVPEISLTPQTVRRFAARFGEQVAVLHSALSNGERYDEWHRIRTGAARVVVGPRSAIFAPVQNLGLIVVDEEHDPSYKQEETPRYQARDVAVMRAHFEGARVVLGSATPSLESWHNAQTGKYALAAVPHRVAGRALPTVHLVNMEEEVVRVGHMPIYSQPLLDAIRARLERGEQTILFLNRRGYSRILQCTDCQWVAQCPNCSLPYTYHSADDCLRCHVCGGWIHLPETCPDCHGRSFDRTGIGTQRAEDALRKCFSHARILRMDADSTSRKYSHDDILDVFRANKADILLGTQMIAKGLDFPNVTLVGVLNADSSLNRPDPRAAERTYQLLTQVSGRAGRAEKPGEVIIQTFKPNEPAIRAAASGEGFATFAAGELPLREKGYYPPYCRMAVVLVRAEDDALAQGWAELYAQSLATVKGLVVSEALPAVLEKAQGWFRYQIVLRAAAAREIAAAFRWIHSNRPPPDAVRISLDMDAINLS